MSDSFVAFRTLELRELASSLTGDEFKIYVLMATYADRHHARCWPGIPELMEQSGYGKGTVERARNNLERKGLVGCIARDRRDELTGRQLPNVYEICGPLHLKNQEARSQNQGGSVPSVKHDSSITRFKNQNQLTRLNKPESVTTTTNHNPASRGLQKESADDSAVPNENVALSTEKRKGQRQKHQNSEDAAQPTEKQRAKTKALSPGSAAPSLPTSRTVDLTPYHQPLPDMDKERLAARIEAECDTTTPIARKMADSWEIGQVEAALSEMKTLAAEGKVKKSKYGVVKWHLETHAVAETDIVKARRREALEAIRPGSLLIDKKSGESVEVMGKAGGKIQVAYEDGASWNLSIDEVLDEYDRAGPEAYATAVGE